MHPSVRWRPTVCLCVRGVPKKPVRQVCKRACPWDGGKKGREGKWDGKKGRECEDEMRGKINSYAARSEGGEQRDDCKGRREGVDSEKL